MKHKIKIYNIEDLQEGDYFSTLQEIYEVKDIKVVSVKITTNYKKLFRILAYRVENIISVPFSSITSQNFEFDHVVSDLGYVLEDKENRWCIRKMWRETDLENFGTL